ncbi:threonine dehydratase [Nevskia soli]|uniref:threonine dehydratase n=1 Tax=Nevskia soli TaxID=418856 RepID=UPI0004A73409|nr:threonine dehydratase [Nevskia soli]
MSISLLPDKSEIDAAAAVIYCSVAPTPQYAWPLLAQRLGTEVWVKHENHLPVGAFKLRGALVYFEALRRREPQVRGVIAATRGNHGQAVAYAASRVGLEAVVVVPHGNSREKNAAMRALGAELIEHGEDFQESVGHAIELAQLRGLHRVPSFHRDLLCGAATFWLELFTRAPQLDVVFAPIGLGSNICGAAAARAATGSRARIIGVVSAGATAYAQSFAERRIIESPVSTRLADGLACRTPDPGAMAIIWETVDRIIEVSEDEVAGAMRACFSDTHNVAEGAGAAALAGALKLRGELRGLRVGLPLSGGNVDREVFAEVLRQAGP